MKSQDATMESTLFSMQRIVTTSASCIASMAVHSSDKTQLMAISLRSSELLVRSTQEDRQVRLWRFPVGKKTQETLIALAFSPEGDWLAALSSRKNKFHLLPIVNLIQLERLTQLRTSELLDVVPSVMNVQMATYLRATNEAGGLNGARYQSQVAQDHLQSSSLSFAAGLGSITCVRWWRSLNGVNYCLIGGSESLISMVNVQQNAEECRCELQNAGTIVSIDLMHETLANHEKRTSMLVKSHQKLQNGDVLTRFYRVVLEKQLPDPIVIKTFPQHFVQDPDFRPQRIKKNSPHVSLCAINSLHASESMLSLFDPKRQKLLLFSNFQWRLKAEYRIPPLQDVSNLQVCYCSADLMLLQGVKKNGENEDFVAVWVALPSSVDHEASSTSPQAHVVHYLTLHENERIERVIPSTTTCYLLQTTHHVYECRPQWSRLALFQALRSQSIALRDALSIGYALGIDMASLCEVVADTIAADHEDQRLTIQQTKEKQQWFSWIQSLYENSRVLPSKAMETMARIGASDSAIDFAKRTLELKGTGLDGQERERVALLIVDFILKQRLRSSIDTPPLETQLRPADQDLQDQLEANEQWLQQFLQTSSDYNTNDMMDVCLSHQQVDKAVLVASSRAEVDAVLCKIQEAGLTPFLSAASIHVVIRAGYANSLLQSDHSRVLRALPIETQVDLMIACPSAILNHQDWLVRHLPLVSTAQTKQLVKCWKDHNADGVELLLTIWLRICQDDQTNETQQQLEDQLKQRVHQYRPPVMIARCVDYGNWQAAAVVYEAHGEVIDAVECRLQSHQLHQNQNAAALSFDESTNGSGEELMEFDGSDQTKMQSQSQSQSQSQLLTLLQRHVIDSTANDRMDRIRTAVLARLMVKWVVHQLPMAELETTLMDHAEGLKEPLATIFFAHVVDKILQTASMGEFDDRDRDWIFKCHDLPFSGSFLFRVCHQFLQSFQLHQNHPSNHQLLHWIKHNVLQNDRSVARIRIPPHSAQQIGKSDPLETHVKVFSCGHVFPKRILEEEILPEFEKRLNLLPTPCFATKQLLMQEFRATNKLMEAPCPICCFNKIQQHIQTIPTIPAIPTDGLKDQENPHHQLYFLHQKHMPPASSSSKSFHHHSPWDWHGK